MAVVIALKWFERPRCFKKTRLPREATDKRGIELYIQYVFLIYENLLESVRGYNRKEKVYP
jgi:hypothetical protein